MSSGVSLSSVSIWLLGGWAWSVGVWIWWVDVWIWSDAVSVWDVDVSVRSVDVLRLFDLDRGVEGLPDVKVVCVDMLMTRLRSGG